MQMTQLSAVIGVESSCLTMKPSPSDTPEEIAVSFVRDEGKKMQILKGTKCDSRDFLFVAV